MATKLEDLFNQIPDGIKEMYEMSIDSSNIFIHNPCCINITCKFVIKEESVVMTFSNKNMIITIWKEIKKLHITVLN